MHRVCKALLSAAMAFASLPALATGIVPFSGTQQFDVASSPPAYLVGGQLFVYQAGSSTCAHVFQDFALTLAHPCPIVLPASGRIPAIYSADGLVRLRLTAAPIPPAPTGIVQFDNDNVAIVTAAASSGGGTPIPDATQIFGTRDLKVRFDDQPITGYVRLNGRTIGSATSGAQERANADTQSLFLSLWQYANVTVVAGKGSTAAADWAANKQLILPDMSGRLLGAIDDMGAGPRGRITSQTILGPTLLGAAGGTETKLVAQLNLPALTWPSTLGISTGTHVHGNGGAADKLGTANLFTPNNAGTIWSGAAQNTGAVATGDTITGSVTSGGSNSPLSSMPPVMLLCFYIKL